jgi:hypothetical protein
VAGNASQRACFPATSCRALLAVRFARRTPMSLSRRSFLLGAGTIITASFVKEVATAVADTHSPSLLKPPEAAKAI